MDEDKESYSSILLHLAKPLLSFIFNDSPNERGFLLGDDFPAWVTEESKVVLKSRYKLCCCAYKHVKDNGSFVTLYLVKHLSQYEYNKGKGSLDKSTENSMKVEVQLNNISMEGKYTCRLVDGAGVCNSWHSLRATVVKDFAT